MVSNRLNSTIIHLYIKRIKNLSELFHSTVHELWPEWLDLSFHVNAKTDEAENSWPFWDLANTQVNPVRAQYLQ